MVLGLTSLQAQNDIIKPLSSGGIGDLFTDDKVNNIRVLSSADETLNIEIRYKGFNEEDKRYVVTGEVLDNGKQVIKQITADPSELARNAEAVDLTFRVTSNPENTQPYISSKYISISIRKQGDNSEKTTDLFGEISKLIGGNKESSGIDGLFGHSFTFDYPKTWRVSGTENMVINVNLTPIGKASYTKN